MGFQLRGSSLGVGVTAPPQPVAVAMRVSKTATITYFTATAYQSGARQRLPSRRILDSSDFVVSDDITLLRRFGETFHCRPSSVTTVTVFLL